MRRLFTALAFVAAVCLLAVGPLASVSVADIVLDLSPTGNPGNVLMQGTTGTTVTGVTQGGFLLDVVSNDIPAVVLAAGSGQGQVTASGGGTFQSVILRPNPTTPFVFTTLDLNPDASVSGTLDVLVEGLDSAGNPQTVAFINVNAVPLVGGGQNRFSVDASNNQLITQVTFTGSGSIVEELRQIRLGGDQTPPGNGNGNGGDPIPEPASLALLALAVGGLAGYRRRRRQSAA